TDLSIKVSEKSDISLERSPLKTSLNANNKQIWCKDCEISVDAKLFQSHIHGITHLAFSKNINEEPLPDPLTLNELKRLNSKQSAAQYEKDRRDRIRLLAYMNR
ncbi:2137_t:CDS:2, partial [Scutellospora calospora]